MFIHFTKTTKMPYALSWGIPSSRCITGSRLSSDTSKPYVCRVCYAKKGPCAWKNSQELLEKNFHAWNTALFYFWADEMAKAIIETKTTYFRWFHSGDLHFSMLYDIIEVAKKCPGVRFYLPTKEHIETLKHLYFWDLKSIPENLTIRLTNHIIDDVATPDYKISGVLSAAVVYAEKENCMAYSTKDHTCGRCRKCWDKNVPMVKYPLHVGWHYKPKSTAKRLGLI